MLSPSLWKRRLVFWSGAILVGVIGACFADIAEQTQSLFAAFAKEHPYIPLFITPLSFGLLVYISLTFLPGTSGSGVPQSIAARILRDQKSREILLGPKVIIGKVILTLLAMLCGAAVGHEGPTVQIGAALMVLFATIGGLQMQRGVVLAGAAAGVAAAFNTPLAGIVFAIEEMARAFEHRNSGILLTAIVLAGTASLSIFGNYNYYGHADIPFIISRDWLAIITVGIVGGVVGGVFARVMIKSAKYIGRIHRRHGSAYIVGFAVLCGLVVAILGFVTHGVTYGAGYEISKALLHQEIIGEWWYAPARFVATLVSAISSVSGGMFSPSLSLGAMIGDGISSWFPNTPAQGIILLAMVAYFAGVTQAPITAFVIVLEITGNTTGAIPLIAAGVIASGIGRLLCPTSLYHALAKFVILRMHTQMRPHKPLVNVE
jgi:H+/Cl- antiporter ClcA